MASGIPSSRGNRLPIKVLLTVWCDNLMETDVSCKGDHVCVMYTKGSSTRWSELGRTEMIPNSLSPRFAKTFAIDYSFRMVQQLKFCIYDTAKHTCDHSVDDSIGELECTLGQIVSHRKMTKPLLLKDKRRAGDSTITIYAQHKADTRVVNFEISAHRVERKFLWWSDPFLKFFKGTETGWQLAHRTEAVDNNLNPKWIPFHISMQTLCGGDVETPIKVDCFDHRVSGSHVLIGSFESTLSEMLLATHVTPMKFELLNPAKFKKKKYINSGVIYIKHCKIEQKFSFLDYIMGGCQIKLTIAIDFTDSNGDPSSPQSLHYINPKGYNEYLTSIRAVGDVMQDYDSSKMFPVYGFGAQVPPCWEVSHNFPINFNPSNPFCAGIEGVAEAYRRCLPHLMFWGPTNCSPIIKNVSSFAKKALWQNSASQYFVLLILTNDVITDIDQTRAAIVEASRLPMSIIIIGVGRADFTAMEFLDTEENLLVSPTGDVAIRNIVKFVPFRQFYGSGVSLAQSILAELPDQMASFFNSYKLRPTEVLE